MSAQPIVNQPFQYMIGLHLIWGSTTTIQMQSGQARDSTNTWDMNLGNYLGQGQPGITENTVTTLNAATVGANGIDKGALEASTWYQVLIIGDQFGVNYPATLIVKFNTSIEFPLGYNIYRRVGWVLTNASSQIIKFWQTGSAGRQFYQWDVPIRALNAGTSTSFAAVSLIVGAPPGQSTPVWLNLIPTANAAGDVFSIRPTGSTGTAGVGSPLNFAGSIAGVADPKPTTRIEPLIVNPSTLAQSVDYICPASGSLTIYVAGFEDYI